MRVLFFAQLKDVTKCDSIELAILSAYDVEQLWAELLKKFPALFAHRASIRLAKNSEYIERDAKFMNSDEVALIPPVSGG
jgi:molybdopterin synthase sulfur carrier subunit